ncbi:unnamed protein product [Leptosia nina]|uniref:Myelin regulatory factor n=1 Tax=Leptosia nina TaxID=320188 RepID=A0AAV1JC95_9NEOP
MDVISDLSPLSPGLIDELEAYMAPVSENCYAPQPLDARRIGGHQLPESPPDSGSENPYSPDTQVSHTIAVSQTILTPDYMLLPEHLNIHEVLQNGEYIYDEMKDNIDHEVLRNDVVVMQDPGELGLRGVRHDMGLSEPVYQNRYNQMRVDMPEMEQGLMTSQLVSLGHDVTPVYTNLQEPGSKKRKLSQDVKCEPAALSPESIVRPPPSVDGSEAGDDAPQQSIRFAPFQQTVWHALFDSNLKPILPPSYIVGADKGFNYSQIDEAFVCQKKNHFQVTCQMQVSGEPHYIKTAEGYKKISSFCLHFYGVKAEDPSQEVRIEQSQSDRTKKPFHPVPVELRREGSKITVGRLHFAETTNNNMRKKGRPNPDQRHFQLVVALKAHTTTNEYIVAAHASDRIIVRASNPGQFESDCSENWWQRGVSENSVHYNGRVGINTDRPDESCVINGNLKVMGHIVHPSDARAKHDIEELDTAQQLKNVQSIRVVKFNYDPSFAEHSGLVGWDPRATSRDTGVLAQEVRKVLPDAVKEAGDVTLPNGDTIPKFLVVNKDRIFMENLGAVKELCKVTGHLESRIDQLEKINKKLCKISVLQRRDSSRSSVSNDSRFSGISASSKSFYSDGNISIDQIREIARSIRRHECCHKLSHNSPKYTRKQCKNCHVYSKYGKYYNYNKTCVRYHSKSDKSENPESNYPTYVSTLETPEKLPDENFSTSSKKKDSCLWLRDEDGYGYGKMMCCRKKYGYDGNELISNKLLQIVITILVFIMAVCLVVMSALYFREHQELLSMKEIRMHEKFSNYPHYGKFNVNSGPIHRATPPDQNQIHNSKPQHAATKKTAKEKGPHKNQEFTSMDPPIPTPTTIHASRNYVKNVLHMEQASTTPRWEGPVSITRIADVIGGGCAFTINTDNELDAECQSSCGLDAPQTYENQGPLERGKPDKVLNETYSKPLEPIIKEKIITPVIADKNTSESKEKDIKKQLKEEIIAESNFLDAKNISEVRMKREVEVGEEGEEILKSSSEEMILSQSDETGKECDTISVGISSKSISNISVFNEVVCARAAHNYTYSIPLSHCLHHKHVDIVFRSPKLHELRLCDLQCKYDSSKNCQLNRDIAKPLPSTDAWTSKLTLECNLDRTLKIRGSYLPMKELCYLNAENKIQFVEFNIHIYRDCHN